MKSKVRPFWALKEQKVLSSECGSAIVEVALVATFILIPLLIGAIDFGRAFYISIEVANAARAGVQYGSQNEVALHDTTNMIKVAQAEAPDVSTTCGAGTNACWVATYPQAIFGCELSDGTSVTPNSTSCNSVTKHPVDFVMVTTKVTYTPMFNIFGLFPPLTLNSQAKMRYSLQ
jgi:Flp pilus assembly protein TadG